MRLRATLRVRNEEMISARKSLRLTQEEASEMAGVGFHAYKHLESLHYSYGPANRVKQDADRVALALNLDPGLVLPPGMAGQSLRSDQTRVAEVDPGALLAFKETAAARMLSVSPARVDATLDAAALSEAVTNAMGSLTARERRVIELRHGIGGEPKTLEEAGAELRISRERVRTIQARAESRLQHPSFGLGKWVGHAS